MRQLSVEQTAVLLDVLPQTTRKWLASGRIVGEKVGRSWVIAVDDDRFAAAVTALGARRAWVALVGENATLADGTLADQPGLDIARTATAIADDLAGELGLCDHLRRRVRDTAVTVLSTDACC